jgi:hypothetical protein
MCMVLLTMYKSISLVSKHGNNLVTGRAVSSVKWHSFRSCCFNSLPNSAVVNLSTLLNTSGLISRMHFYVGLTKFWLHSYFMPSWCTCQLSWRQRNIASSHCTWFTDTYCTFIFCVKCNLRVSLCVNILWFFRLICTLCTLNYTFIW